MTKKKRSASSSRWLQEHVSDPFVHKAQKLGLRSRASFKLDEIQQKDKLIKPGMTVVDLGSAPGSWSQLAAELVGEQGCVIACDILPMDPLAGVAFLQGDFREDAVLNALLDRIGGRNVDVVLSDMAPNMSGNATVDQELALEMCGNVLKKNGCFVVKVFHGEGFEQFVQNVRNVFSTVRIRKPDSSRSRSSETYIVATGFKL